MKILLVILLCSCQLIPAEYTATEKSNIQALDYPSQNYFFLYDFTSLTGADESVISNGNPGLQDYGLNNHTLTVVNSPKVRGLTYNGFTEKTLKDNLTAALDMGISGGQYFSSSKFRLWFVLQSAAGNATNQYFIGAKNSALQGIAVYATGSTFRFDYSNSDGSTTWRTNDSWTGGVNGITLFEVEVDFDLDKVSMFINGYKAACVQISGNISLINPANWTNTANLYVGSLNNNGTAVSNSNINSILAVAGTPSVTGQDERDIRDYFYNKYFHWQSEIHITNQTDVATKRTDLVNRIFNGNGLPAIAPDTVITNYSGALHIIATPISGAATITKYVFTKQDIDGYNWTNVVYRLYSTVPNGKAILHVQGHLGSNAASTKTAVGTMLLAGYDVLFCAPPIASLDNTETNPTITFTDTKGHNQLLSGGLDRIGYNPLELFFFDKTSILSLVEDDYTDIYGFGHSGGGWTITLLSAMDTRLTKTVCNRGTLSRSFMDSGDLFNNPDYEQGGTLFLQSTCGARLWTLFNDHSYLDLNAMCSDNRKMLVQNHINDTNTNKGGDSGYAWEQTIKDLALSLNGTFDLHIYSDAESPKLHKIQPAELSEAMTFFNL